VAEIREFSRFVICPVFRLKRRRNLGNSLLSHYVAGEGTAVRPRFRRDRRARGAAPPPSRAWRRRVVITALAVTGRYCREVTRAQPAESVRQVTGVSAGQQGKRPTAVGRLEQLMIPGAAAAPAGAGNGDRHELRWNAASGRCSVISSRQVRDRDFIMTGPGRRTALPLTIIDGI